MENDQSAIALLATRPCEDCGVPVAVTADAVRYAWPIRCSPCWDRAYETWQREEAERQHIRRTVFADLSTRAGNSLVSAGYRTRAGVAIATDDALLALRMFGQHQLREVRAAIPSVPPERKPCAHCQGTGWEP